MGKSPQKCPGIGAEQGNTYGDPPQNAPHFIPSHASIKGTLCRNRTKKGKRTCKILAVLYHILMESAPESWYAVNQETSRVSENSLNGKGFFL